MKNSPTPGNIASGSIVPGISKEKTVTVTPEMGVSHLGDGPVVLSTPHMIELMEYACLESVADYLGANQQSVGTMVHIWHRAALKMGEEATIRTKLLEVNENRLLFEVEVTSGDKRIGDGTHERFIIDLDRFRKDK